MISTAENEDVSKNRGKTTYLCECCHFTTCKRQNYDKHIQSLRHNKNATMPEQKQYVCKQCNKRYFNHSGLWKHNKTCIVVAPEDPVLVKKVDKLQEQVQNLTELINNMMKNGKNDIRHYLRYLHQRRLNLLHKIVENNP
jgi:hypothetical protein